MEHMYVTSGLLSWSSGSTSVAHFDPGSNTHFGMRIYVVIKIVSCIYKNSKDSQIIYRDVLNYHGSQGFTIQL